MTHDLSGVAVGLNSVGIRALFSQQPRDFF
jgi:hypothetical protein